MLVAVIKTYFELSCKVDIFYSPISSFEPTFTRSTYESIDYFQEWR